ncbi:cytochrome c [Echinicola pacifica]|uniref:Cytochrome c n=1 Tax=Echinicola pacifica TaxID=346377 RepID=A0A918UL08_9BACT|nr:C40 family peptidase [Echinicola pacifica]GGZ17580.1 cytochrome c [Echinicola pacifica]
MKINKIYYVAALLLSTWACQEPVESTNERAALIDAVKEEYAPDKRVALFDVEASQDTLSGETNLPQALSALKAKMDEKGLNYVDNVALLPAADLDGNTKGVVTISVANIRSAPKHSAELATQATMGMPVNVLKKEGSWYLVQTPDDYISWVDAAGIAVMDEQGFNAWTQEEKVIYTGLLGYVYEDENESMMVSDLTAGNVLALKGESKSRYKIALPDGREGYINKSEAEPFEAWLAERSLSDQNLINTAKSMMGIPYLWGGTSIKGVDCSGFTKTIYYLNGQVIPRDASQQINEGDLVDSEKNWDKLEVGDLLFFGKPATDSTSERVIHVGMWIGNGSFIHSRGRVRVSSFDPNSANFDEYELGRYLRTKRIRQVPSERIISVDKIIN